jgi:SAM-dependent methyltransferase
VKPATSDFWTPRTVAWYERANAAGDYAACVLGAVMPALADCRTALDVGAGFGALTLPLARRLRSVTALEPSFAMAAALRRAVARGGFRNVTLVPAAWGEVRLPRHDLVLCAHVGPLLREDSAFYREVTDVAGRAVVLVHDAPGADDKFFFRDLYPALLGRPYERTRDADASLRALAALGISPHVSLVEYRSDQPFTSLEDACDFWMTYMRLEGSDMRAFLRHFLLERLTREGAGWRAPFRKRVRVILWRV